MCGTCGAPPALTSLYTIYVLYHVRSPYGLVGIKLGRESLGLSVFGRRPSPSLSSQPLRAGLICGAPTALKNPHTPCPFCRAPGASEEEGPFEGKSDALFEGSSGWSEAVDYDDWCIDCA